MMRVRTKTSFCPKTGFLLAEPPTREGSDQADSNLLWARSFRIGTPGSLGRIPNADPPRLPEEKAASSQPPSHNLTPRNKPHTPPPTHISHTHTTTTHFTIHPH